MCHPLFSQCVTLGLPCTAAPRELFFSYINEKNQCGDVDAAPRVPPELFRVNNTIALDQYRLTTQNGWGIMADGQLSTGNCKSKGYTYPAGSRIIDWAPKRVMTDVCKSQCNCEYPDCPDAPDDPSRCNIFGCTPFFCSLCGPKYNSPIEVNLYTKE
eukprot:gene29374-22344_t